MNQKKLKYNDIFTKENLYQDNNLSCPEFNLPGVFCNHLETLKNIDVDSELKYTSQNCRTKESDPNMCQKIVISNPLGSRIISGVPTPVGDATFTMSFPTNSGFFINGMGTIMGYINPSYTANNKYISENIINLYTDPYIYVRVNDYGTIYNKVDDKRLLAKVILDGSNNTFIFDNKNFVYKTYEFTQPVDIERLEIELLDRTGSRLDLNNCDFSMTLELDVIENTNIYSIASKGYLR